MEIIHQKLIWFLGSLATYLIVSKLKFSEIGVNRKTITKIRFGLGLLLLASAFGIIYRIEIFGELFAKSYTAFFIETIIGYLIGWIIVIWGLLNLAFQYFDNHGKALKRVDYENVTDIIVNSLSSNDSGDKIFDNIFESLSRTLKCQAITYHSINALRKLDLIYNRGLTPDSEKIVKNPEGKKVFYNTALDTGMAVNLDKNNYPHEYAFLESPKGRLRSAIAVPVTALDKKIGVFTLYKTSRSKFNINDLKFISTLGMTLNIVLNKHAKSKETNTTNTYINILNSLTEPFDSGDPFISGFVKSSKILNESMPFNKLSLYIHSNDGDVDYNFDISKNSKVRIMTGVFPADKYPELSTIKQDGVNSNSINKEINNKRYISTAFGYSGNKVSLVIDLKENAEDNLMLLQLIERLAQKALDNVAQEKISQDKDKAIGWMGVVNYYFERAAEITDFGEYLNEIASAIVDTAPTSTCRIMLSDPSKSFLKTIALASVPETEWQGKYQVDISLNKLPLHKHVLDSAQLVDFDQEKSINEMGIAELLQVFPKNIQFGCILPIIIEGKGIGVVSVGDIRKSQKDINGDGHLQFLKNIVGLISMVLSWQKEKKKALTVKSLGLDKTKHPDSSENTFYSEDKLVLDNLEDLE